MFNFLGRLATAHSWLICIAWVAVGASLTVLAPPWDARTQDDDIRFLPERCASVRGYKLLSRAFPRDVFASRAILTVERPDHRLTSADFRLVDDLVAGLIDLSRAHPEYQIGRVASYHDPLIGKRLTSDDGQCTLIQVPLGSPFLAVQTRATMDACEARLCERLARAEPGAPRLHFTGPAGIGRDLTRASASGLEGTTLATVVLVVVVLLLLYRAPLLALVPLGTIALSVWVALHLLALVTLIPGVHLVNVAKVFAIVILYGAGTDYCLFLIGRYQEQLARGQALTPAIRGSVRKVGSALTASAGTVICGLGMMGFAEFAKVRCAGPAIALSLAVALLASLTLAPALLQLLGRAAFWPTRVPGLGFRVQSRGLRGPSGAGHDPLWDRISRGVVARPVLIWSVAVLALLPLMVIGLRVRPNYKPTGELGPSSSSVQGIAAIQRHFTAGEIGPLTVLLASPTDWSTPAGRQLVRQLSVGFAGLPNVAEVRSLTQPLGKALAPPIGSGRPPGLFGGVLQALHVNADAVLDPVGQIARRFYVARVPEGAAGAAGPAYVTRLDVVFRSDPFGSASQDTLDEIQIWLRDYLPRSAEKLGGVQAECYGVTVNARDMAEVTEADRTRVNSLVLLGTFAILLVLVRRPWLAAYLLLSVLFSYLATLGATAVMAHWWFGRPLGQVDWRVPFFLFTILVAVGEDYNIFLVTRLIQERRRYGPTEGMRRALAHTGATITSCGLIMAGTFATLMLGGLGTLVQIGFALACGILLDTFLVRPFLVPAFMLFVWRHVTAEAVPQRPTTRAPTPLEVLQRATAVAPRGSRNVA
jgi:RND superfamily putative drug exporter